VVGTTFETSGFFVLSGSSNRATPPAINLFPRYPHGANDYHTWLTIRRYCVVFTVEPRKRDALVPRDLVALSNDQIGPPTEQPVGRTPCELALHEAIEILSTGPSVPNACTCLDFDIRRILILPITKGLLLCIPRSLLTNRNTSASCRTSQEPQI
jgi:hypothetical protein